MNTCQGKNCWAHIQHICEHAGIVRVFSCDQQYEIDPYCIAITFIVKNNGFIEFVGLDEKLKICQFRAIRSAVYNEGLHVQMTRIKDGKKHTVEVCHKKWLK